jgi:hypothetical protein
MQDTTLKWTVVASLQFVLHNPEANVSFLIYTEVDVHYLVLIALDGWMNEWMESLAPVVLLVVIVTSQGTF